MNTLASDFSGLAWIFVAAPILLIVIALASFVPSARGHWSGLLMASLAVGVGLLFLGGLMSASIMRSNFGAWVLFLTPPVLGILSIGVWSECRGASQR